MGEGDVKRIIFLDVDGVLCISRSIQRKYGENDPSLIYHPSDYSYPLERSMLENLRYVLEKSGAKIVISSSWKLDAAMTAFLKYGLETVGISSHVIIGVTSNLDSGRGDEIMSWLQGHPDCTGFVVDDSNEVSIREALPHEHMNFVCTYLKPGDHFATENQDTHCVYEYVNTEGDVLAEGLTRDKAEEALTMLMKHVDISVFSPPECDTGLSPSCCWDCWGRGEQLLGPTSLTVPPLVTKILDDDIVIHAANECMKYLPEWKESPSHLQSDNAAIRRTQQYGYDSFRLDVGDRTYTEPPDVIRALGKAVQRLFKYPLDTKEFDNIIVSAHECGYQLEPSTDTGVEALVERKYCFDESVFGVVLVPDSLGQLYIIRDDVTCKLPSLHMSPVFVLNEIAGTCFELTGELRHAPYRHGVSMVHNFRLSVTFRHVIFLNDMAL